jgi:hypothetical protein
MPKEYDDELGHHIESDGKNDPAILYRWRIVSDEGPWRQRKGKELRWAMTEDQAAAWARANPQTTIEKVPGSGHVYKAVQY